MKIKALRLKQFGCFDGPVRIENFSGKLDVLVGHNELGKSTVLDALKVVFSEKHSTGGGPKTALGPRIPYAGGAPVIEVDFDTGGNSYRLRKQFKSQKMAELKLRGDGRIVARNDEVEDELEQLFGAASGGREKTGLLWLSQGDALQPVSLTDPQSDVLKSLIERGVEDVGGGARSRRMLEMVRSDLAALVTPGRDQPKGEYKLAIEEHGHAAEALAAAKIALGEAEGHKSQLDKAEAELQARTAPEIVERLEKTVEIARKTRDEAREASVKLAGARERMERLALSLDRAQKQRIELAGAVERFAELGPDIENGTKAHEAASSSIEDARREIAELEEKLIRIREREASLRQEMQAADARERQDALTARRDELMRKRESALTETALVAKIDGRLRELAPPSEETLGGIERETAAIASLEDRLDKGLTRIRLRYQKGGEGRIHHGDHALEDGTELDVVRQVTLDIEGIGQIEVDPGPMPDVQDVQGDIEAHRSALDDLLGAAGADDPATARSRFEEGRNLVMERHGVAARLESAAPDGIEAVEAKLTQLDDELRQLEDGAPQLADVSGVRPRDEIRAEMDAVSRDGIKLDDAFRAAHKRRSDGEGALGRIEEQLRNSQAEFDKLKKQLPDDEERGRELLRLESLVAGENEALVKARAAVETYETSVPDAERRALIETDFKQAQSGLAAHLSSVQALKEEIARLRGILAHDRVEDVAAEIQRLEEEERGLSERVQKFKSDIQAMRKLQSALELAMDDVRSAYFQPVVKRIAPYFGVVFPDAGFNLDDRFAIADVERRGQREDLGRLSAGTREQISVLVRLGYARLLSDRKASTPLILDDALVFSDDDRLQSLFKVFGDAAEHHQVFMLTCRAKSFEGLGGHRLELEAGEF